MIGTRSVSRQDKILHILARQQTISIQDLSAKLRVSSWTIRRDLTDLVARGLITRRHGVVALGAGAITPAFARSDETLSDGAAREAAKRRIGHAAAQLLQHGQHVVLSAGTTTTEVALAIKELRHRQLSIVTNALNIAQELAGELDSAVTCTGGDVHGDYYTLTGPVAERALRSYFFDVAVIGVSGLTIAEGLTVKSQLNAVPMEIMVQHSMKVIVVAEQHKLGRVSFAHLAPLAAVDILVTDALPSTDFAKQLQLAGVDVVIAPG